MAGMRWALWVLSMGIVAWSGCSSPSGCSTDNDCKGSRVCQFGECVDSSSGTAQCGATIVACNCNATTLYPGQITNNKLCASGQGQASECNGVCAGGGVPWTVACYCRGGSGGGGGSTSGGGGGSSGMGMKLLSITPVAQETPEWCWLASAQMIFQYYGVPGVNNVSYQCGIMGAVTGPQSVCFYDCSQCVFGSGSDAEAAAVLEQYPAIVQQNFLPQTPIPQLVSQLEEVTLTPTMVEQQIDAGNPIELGVTVGGPFQGMAGHAVVVVGYDIASDGTFSLVINDPFPYDTVVGSSSNPYYPLGATVLQPGQYLVEYSRAMSGLQWSATILVSRSP